MARYIDMDLLKEMIEAKADTVINAKQQFHYIAGWLDHLPPADVVPKSEYEKLIGKLECLLCHATGGRLSKHTYDLRTMETVVTDCENETYNDGFAEGYKESAREIFEEIEDVLNNIGYFDEIDFLSLKKKYTESEGKG